MLNFFADLISHGQELLTFCVSVVPPCIGDWMNQGFLLDRRYTNISDEDLDRVILVIKECHPNDGERMMSGHLLQQGIFIQRWRLRASIHRVDPVNTALRRSRTVRRRVYSVPGPNSVWHMDGNHKLIRWHFVVHGAIDGYSRVITFLKCSSNNTAGNVLMHFQRAVEVHGLPTRL